MKKTHIVLVNPSPTDLQGLHIHLEGYLFNELHHLKQQGEKLLSYYLIDESKHTLEARFSCYLSDNQILSPLKAPFGGLEFNPKLALEYLHQFWHWIENDLQKYSPLSITINTFPFAYQAENQAHLTHLYLQNGFQITQTELNYHLDINSIDFRNRLHLSEKRRLDKCRQAGFKFTEWPQPDLSLVYHFIKKARQRKNYPISLDEASFIQLFENFPSDFQVFTVKRGVEIGALTVTVKINSSILYNFYPADNESYLRYSPQVLLIDGLYKYAQGKDFQMLDLGIATEASLANFGLIRFKRNLGAMASLKLKFRKEFI